MADESKELTLQEFPRVAGLPERFQPSNLTELMSWAELYVASGLAQKGDNKATIVIKVQFGAELNISPSQAISGIAVINNKPSIYGDLGKAIFMRDAAYKTFEERPPDECLAKKQGWCKIVMKDGAETIRTFSIEEATTAGLISRSGSDGPWAKYPGRMLMWRARWWAMRDADPRVFKGLAAAEEMREVVDAEEVKVDGVLQPRRRSDGVPKEAVENFLKDVKPGLTGPTERSQPMPGKPPADRSKLKKVQILDTAEKKVGATTFYVVKVQGPSGAPLETSTFSRTDFDKATELKGDFALIDTKEVTKPDKDPAKPPKKFLNLVYIETAPNEPEEAPPQDEPGANG